MESNLKASLSMIQDLPYAENHKDEVAQESSPLLDTLAEIIQGVQQCNHLLQQQASPQKVVQDIVDTPSSNLVESHQKSSTREGDTRMSRTEVFMKLDDQTASMQLLAVDVCGIENIVVESTLRDRIFQFRDDIQGSLNLMLKMVEVDARTDQQDDEVKNPESHATVLDQNDGSNMITNQAQDCKKNIVMSSTTVSEPCVFINQNLEVEGASSKIMLQEGVSNKQGEPQDEADNIDPKLSVDEDHGKQNRDREESPQEEKKEDVASQEHVETPEPCVFINQNLEFEGASSKIMLQQGVSNKQGEPQDEADIIDPKLSVDEDHGKQNRDMEESPQEEKKEDVASQEHVETPDTPSQCSKIRQEESLRNKQDPLQDIDEVKDPHVESKKEYDLKFPSLRPCKEGTSQEKMNGGDRSKEKEKDQHDNAVEKKLMHKGSVKQSPDIVAETYKRDVAVAGTYAGKNRFSLGEYFTFTKTTGSKKARKKPQKC